jgi:hypothetical protein
MTRPSPRHAPRSRHRWCRLRFLSSVGVGSVLVIGLRGCGRPTSRGGTPHRRSSTAGLPAVLFATAERPRHGSLPAGVSAWAACETNPAWFMRALASDVGPARSRFLGFLIRGGLRPVVSRRVGVWVVRVAPDGRDDRHGLAGCVLLARVSPGCAAAGGTAAGRAASTSPADRCEAGEGGEEPTARLHVTWSARGGPPWDIGAVTVASLGVTC